MNVKLSALLPKIRRRLRAAVATHADFVDSKRGAVSFIEHNPPGKRFCGDCGAAFTAPAAAAVAAQARILASGERRHLTVLFCDLVGSTELAARLDPEEWQETLAAYHRSAATGINRFGGHVANYLGDGVMAYFGFPEVHENDAEGGRAPALRLSRR
jgi:class 3 adenylate cyclase